MRKTTVLRDRVAMFDRVRHQLLAHAGRQGLHLGPQGGEQRHRALLDGQVFAVLQGHEEEHPPDRWHGLVVAKLDALQRQGQRLGVVVEHAACLAVDVAGELIQQHDQRQPTLCSGRQVVMLAPAGRGEVVCEEVSDAIVDLVGAAEPEADSLLHPGGVTAGTEPEIEHLLLQRHHALPRRAQGPRIKESEQQSTPPCRVGSDLITLLASKVVLLPQSQTLGSPGNLPRWAHQLPQFLSLRSPLQTS